MEWGFFAVALAFIAVPARADVYQTYDLAWSGASSGNSATANGTITLDLTTLPNPEINNGTDIYSSIQSLEVTVSNATSGNGTFTKADLCNTCGLNAYTYWWTVGATLNLNAELVGQSLGNGHTWGTPDLNSGDFSLFFRSPGPQSGFPFLIGTNGGTGDVMQLTEFAPAVPEPTSLALLSAGLLGFFFVRRRHRNEEA